MFKPKTNRESTFLSNSLFLFGLLKVDNGVRTHDPQPGIRRLADYQLSYSHRSKNSGLDNFLSDWRK